MNYINEKVVLEFYLKEIEADKINFLRGHHKERVKERVEKLLEGASIHDKIEAAKSLWKALFEASMSYVDSDKRGYDIIFAYFDEFVKFEELIFASDSFYRDHTLHSLWVYFLGEYLQRNKDFEYILNNTEDGIRQVRQTIEEVKIANKNGFLNQVLTALEEMENVLDKTDASMCVAILCHDLGYPLKKIEKINKSIKGILPYFSINNINEFKFKYTEVEQIYIERFINSLSTTLNASLEGDNKSSDEIISRIGKIKDGTLIGINHEEVGKLTDEELCGIKRDYKVSFKTILNSDLYLEYSKNFEDYKHGIMSAFLLTKNLKAFEKMDIKYSNSHIPISSVKFPETAIKQSILRAMTEHTNSSYSIQSFNGIEPFLAFIDELEEFSRISRANKNREYVEQFCHTRLFMEEQWFNIEFIFDNDNLTNLDPERAFKGRCERFLKLFDIPRLDENLKIRLKCIGKLKCNDNEYVLEIAKKYVKITINGEEQFIPKYLKTTEYYSREEYEQM